MNSTQRVVGLLLFSGLVVVGLVALDGPSTEARQAPGPVTDRSRIAYTNSEGQAGTVLYAVNPDGSGRQTIETLERADIRQQWSPDHSRLAFESGDDGFMQLVVVDADGTNQVTLSPAGEPRPDEMRPLGYDWSPDGKKIAFAEYRIRDEVVTRAFLIANVDTGEQVRLLEDFGTVLWPKWSPDGSHIAFTGVSDDGALDLYTVRPDGSSLTRLTDLAPWRRFDLAGWDPGGTALVVTRHSRRRDDSDVLLVPVDGSEPQKLASSAELDEYGPIWSPSGDQIAFFGAQGNKWNTTHVYVVDLTSGTSTMLNPTRARSSFGFDWSPSGEQIVFHQENREGDFVSRINVSTHEVKRVIEVYYGVHLDW